MPPASPRPSRGAAVRRAREAWRRLSPFFDDFRGRIALMSLIAVVAGAAEAALLALIAAAAAALSEDDDEVLVDLGPVVFTAELSVIFAAAIALTVLRAVLQLLLAYLPAWMSATAMAQLRRRLFDAFTTTSWTVQSQERDGHFQSLMITHVNSTSQAIIAIGSGISGALLFLTMVASAFLLSVTTALIILVASAALFLLLQPVAKRLRASAKALSAENVEYSKGVQEVVLLAEESQVFGVSDSYRSTFYGSVDAVRTPLLRTRFLSTATPALFQSLALLMLVIALLVVSTAGSGTVASLGAIVLILIRALSFGQQLQQAIANVDQVAPFMNRLADALAHYDAHPRQDGTRPLEQVDAVALRDVDFHYVEGEPVLSGIDVEVRRGEALGIVGPSGAGKSSIVQLLLRLRTPTSGAVTVNDVDAQEYRLADWQQRIAYLPQTSQLVWGTAADNIRFYRPEISDSDVELAARRAHIHDEILSWPEGYDTVIGQRASAVSGGQRQRLCLARALAGQPDVLILDEPTSALDVKSEELVQQTLQELKADMVLLLVAHRLSTLSVCDRVMVVVDGRVQDIAPPQRLEETNAFFREVTDITRRQSS